MGAPLGPGLPTAVSLALHGIAHARCAAAAIVGFAFPITSSTTRQADALMLVATKLQSAPAVEGELPENSVTAYGANGDDLLLAPSHELMLEQNT